MDNKQLNNNFDAAVRLWCEDQGLVVPDKDGDSNSPHPYELSDNADGKGVYISRWDFQFADPEQTPPTRTQLKAYTVAQARQHVRQRQRRLHRVRGGLSLFYDEGADELLVSIAGQLRPISLGAAVL